MLPLPKGAAPKFILLFLVSLLIKEISSEGRVVCYYTNWSVYRPGTAKFNPQNINPYLCTHLIYAFGGFTKDNTLKPFDKYQDIEQGGYSKFTGLKAYNKNLKTLLAIGGWNEGSSRFSPLVASSERRQQFIKNILKFLRQNHFDGLDLDWEYPAFRDGGKTRDKENYAQFVQELRSEFDRESSKTGRPRLLLTMAVPAGTEYIEKGYDIPKLNRYLDWFNLLSYDYHSAYEPSVNHHSPLYSLEEESEYNYDADLNIDYSVKFYLQAGADRDKLVLGIPTYGRTYTLVSEDITDLGSPADGPGDQGDATREKGYLAYYEICQNLRDDPEWTVMQPNSKAMGPYAFRGNQWVGYDDEAIVKRKAEYVVENGLGGIMFWSIDNDDFRGSCGKKPYPLIEAAKEAMFDRLGLGDNEVARPNPPRKPSRSRSRLGSSNRNNIINESSNTHKTNLSEKKSSSRRNSNKKRLNRVTSTTTTTTTTTTPSSLYIGGRSTTPPPPTTPDPGADFKCEEEGFFAHPRDCKKYFWCLDSGPSNLGIVAHQFTCPSGLYFNTAADSCDFSRNVLCKTKTTTVKPTTTTAPITTSTTIRTTTNSPRITAATSRQTFLRHTSTTEQPSEEEEYEDEDEDESIGPEEEEDPKVIKELIQLIKKVGGLEELEKQLLQQEDGSMVLSNTKSDVSSTTQSTISKSLYHKVLSRPNNLSSFRRQFETNKLARSTVSPSLQEEEDSVEVEESSKKSDSRYSSVVRNSRPSPQNAGIDKLPEFEGFLKEKPKYVTIQRTRPTVAVESNFDEEENEDVSTEFVEQSTRDSKNRRVDVVSTQTTTVTPSYVNIRRTRPSTAAPESSEVTEEEKIISSTRSSYLPLNRRRISTVTTATDEVTTAPSTGTPFASTTQRYKYIERTKSSTLQPEEIKTTTGFSKINFNNVDENSAPITVQNLELNEYTTQAPIQKIATTHIYENIARRTTFSTTPSSTLVETTTAEPTTIRAFTTTNPTTTTLSSSTNTTPLLEQDPTPVDNFQNQNSILPITDPSPNKYAGLDTDGKDTTELITDKKTDKVHLIGEDEVTLTDSKVKVSSSSTLSSYNITKFNEFESSLKATNPSLSKIDKQVTVTSTDKLTTPNTDPTTPQTTIQKDEITTTKDFLETVSSPRPFGFPRRRTRPTTARKPSSSTNHEIVTSTSTVTPPPSQKVSPLKQLKSNSRTTSRYQSRTNVEDVSSASNNAREFNEIGKGNNLHTSHNPPKRPLNTYSYSGENADDELDNSISSRKRSYSWRSQVNRNFRPWKTTTTVGTTPLPNLGPDRTYRPKYGDERDNLETDDSYDYKSYRGESESDSYSTINKARQFEGTRGNVQTSSDDVASQRRIGVRLRNQGAAVDESENTQSNNRRNRVHTENQSVENNSYRRRLNRVSTSSQSKQDDANFERNRVNIQKSSEDSSSQKRLGSKLQNQGISVDESENESTDNNSHRRKFHRVQSESDMSVSTENIANFERSRGSTQISSEDANFQRRFENQGDIIDESQDIERGNRRYGVQNENQAADNNSYRRKFYRIQSKYDSSQNGNAQASSQKRLGNQGVFIGESKDTERGNRRYGVQAENESTDNNSNRRNFHRGQSQSGSSLSTQDDAKFERSRGNFEASSDDTSSQRSIGVRLQNPSVTIDESEEAQITNRRNGVKVENQSIDNTSNLHKSIRIESQSDLSLSSKDVTNFEKNRGDFQASSEDVASQKRIESESGSTFSIKHDSNSEKSRGNIQTSSGEESSQKKVDSKLRNESSSISASEDTQSEIQSSNDSSSHRFTSEAESSSSSNSENTASRKRTGNRFHKLDTSINDSDEARKSNRRYGTQVDNESTDGSYRYKSNHVISESDSTLSTSENGNHGNQRITTENLTSHKIIGVRLQNPTTTLHESEEIRKSNRRYGVQAGSEILSEGNNEDLPNTRRVDTSKTTVYEVMNGKTLPSSRVVTENITQYFSNKTNMLGEVNVEKVSSENSQLSSSDSHVINKSTITNQNHDGKINLQASFAVDTSGVSAINSKTTSEETHTSINSSGFTKDDNTLTELAKNQNINKQTSQSQLIKDLNEEDSINRTSSEQLSNTNIKINEEGNDLSGKSDVRQYYTSGEDDRNTVAALHQGKIKSGNKESTTFVRNKGTVNQYKHDNSREESTQQSSTTEFHKEEQSLKFEDGNSNTAEKTSEKSISSQSSGTILGSKQVFEEQSGTNIPRRRIVVKKRIYRPRNNNTDGSATEGKVTDFSSTTTNSASGRRSYEQRTKLTLNKNVGYNSANGRRISESSVSKSNIDASENLLNKEIEAIKNGIVEKDSNTVSGNENTSRRRIQTSRNLGSTNNVRSNTINSAKTRINITEENSIVRNVQSKENTEISENEEHNEIRRRQRIRPTRPFSTRTNPAERKTRPNVEGDLSSLLAVDRSKWEFLDRTKITGGGTMVRRRRPVVKTTTEIPTEIRKSVNRRVRPVTSTTQSTNSVRQRNQFLYRNRASVTTNKTDGDISLNTQNDGNALRAETVVTKEEDNLNSRVGGSLLIKNKSVSEDASLSSVQNNLLDKSTTSEESNLVKTSTKGSESSPKFAGNRKITTSYNKFDEDTSEVESNGEILSFEESQNGSFRGKSQNALKSSTVYTLKTNKGTVLDKSSSSGSTTHFSKQTTSAFNEEAERTSTTIPNEEDSTTLIPEIDSYDKVAMTTTEESSTLVPQTTLYDDFTTTTDATTTMEEQPMTETQTTMEPPSTFGTPTTIDTQTITYSPTTDTPIGIETTTEINGETTIDIQTTMDGTTTIDTPITMDTTTTKDTATTEDFYKTMDSSTTMETPITTISDSLTEGNFKRYIEGNEQLNIGERFASRTSEKGKNSRSFQSTIQQNTFQTENDFQNRQSANVKRKYGANSEYSNSQNSEDVQHLRGKDNVEILYHRQKYWETFNKSRSEEGDSPIIYIGTFNNNGYKPGRTGKFSPAEIQKIQEIFNTAQQTEFSFSEGSKNINRGRAKFSATGIEQNEATKTNESKEIRLTTTKEYKRTGSLLNGNSHDLTRSQISKTNFGRGKTLSVDERETTKFTEIPNVATTEGNERYTTTNFNIDGTTINADNIDITTPQIITMIPDITSDQTIDFGIFDQETLTSTLSLGEEETTFPPSRTSTDKTTTNALDKTGLSAFENNLSASTAGFVETTTNSNLFFSEKSQKLAQSSGEISSKLNSDGFSRSRTRISSIQQGSSKRINAAQANEINNLDLNLKVNVSKESTVRSNAVESNKLKSRTTAVLSKTNSIQVNQNSEESTFEEGLQFSGSRYGSNAGRNLKVSNFQANRRQFIPSSKRKQPNSSAESTQSALIETATESSTPSKTERTTIRSTLIFLKGPRPDGRYAEEHGQDIISSFHRGSSYSTRTEEDEEDHSEDLLSRFEQGSKKISTGFTDKTTFFRDEDSLHIATENEHNRDEDVKLNVGTDNANEEVSTIRSTLIFLKGPKPFNTGEEVSTTSKVEDSTIINEETTTDASKQITPTRRTYVASNRTKTTYTTSDDSSITSTDQQNEDRRSTLSFRRQQTVRGSSAGKNQETTENLNISVKSSDDEESGESDLSLNNRGTIKKTYSTINRDKVKRPLQPISEIETTSDLNEVEESSTISPFTIAPSQQKPTRRRYNPSIRIRSTTVASQLTSEESEQNREIATEKTENVRRYSSFRRKTSSARTSRIPSQEESENSKAEVLEDSVVRPSNTDSEGLEDRTETSHENELENNASKNRTTFARRDFSNRFKSSKGRTGGQRTRSYGSVQLNDVNESESVSSKTYGSINRSRTAKTTTFDETKQSEESSTEEASSISLTEDTSEYTTIQPEVDSASTQISNDEASEVSTKENVVTQATTTELEDGSAITEENKENLNSKTTTIQNEEIESTTLTASEKNNNLSEEHITATVIEDLNTNLNENKTDKTTDENISKEVTLNIRERLRLNRLKTKNSNSNFENTFNRSSKTVEAVQKQTISSTRQENSENNKYKTAGLRNNLYGTNGRRKFTTLKQKQNEEESTTASSIEEGVTTDQPESVESDLFASSLSPDSLVTESIESTTNSKVEQLTTFEDLTTLITTESSKADGDEITLEPNFSTTASTETSTKINDKVENEVEMTATTIEDIFDDTTTSPIVEESEEINKTYIASSKQIEKTEDTTSKLNTTFKETSKQTEETTTSFKRPYTPGRKFVNTRTGLEPVTQNEDKISTDAKAGEKITTTGRTYSGFNRNKLLLKTNQNVKEETTGSRVALNDGSVSEYRRRYGSSRTKSIQTENSQIEANDQKSAPAFSFSTRTRAKFLNRQNIEKSSNAEQNELSTQERTSLNENEDNSSLSEELRLENEKRDEEILKNAEIALNLEKENSTIITSGISENHTEIGDEFQSSQNYSDSLSEAHIENTNEIKTTILNNLESEIKLESNSSSSAEKIEDTKIRLVRPLPYLKNKNIFENRKTSIKLAQNTENEEKINLEQRSQDSNDSITQDFLQESKEENKLNESLNKVNESEVTSIKQLTKTTSQLKFQRKPFPLSRNLSETVLEKNINETESAQNTFKENDEEINIDSSQEESSVTKLSDEITELHANLNEEHTPEILDSTNSTALNVNNSANNDLVREDSNLRNLNNQASNPLKFTRRFQKIASGNRFQINNNQNTESSVRTVNGRRVRVLKFRKPSLNTVTDNEGKVNVTTQQRPFVRKFFRKRPSAIATTLSDTEDSIENSEKENEARDSPVRKFRKILVRKTPVFQEDTEEELQELQLNTTKDSFVQKESSDSKTHLLKVQKSSEDLDLTDDLDLQNEFSDTNVTSSYNIMSNTTETKESNNTSTSAEIEENAFTESEFNATSIEALEQTSGENMTTTESGEQNTNTDSMETTVPTPTTKNKLFASRRPYKPTKPSISAITSTEAPSITTKTYVRKYISNFKIPKPPTEINTNLGANDENGEVFIRPLSSFSKNRPTYQNKIKTINDENEEDLDFEDEEVENEDFIERNLQEQFSQSQQERELYDRDQYNQEQYDREQYNREQYDREQYNREQFDREQHDRDRDQDDRNDFVTDSVEDIGEEKVEPEPVPISRPPVLQSINRFNSKSSGLPNLIIRLNNGFDSQSEKSELEVIPHSSEESTDSFSASYEDEDEASIDEASEDEFQSAEKVDLPIPSNTPLVQTTKATPLINHPGFIPKRPQSNKPRVINRPTFTTVHPASLKFRVTSPLASTPPSFKTNNTRSYERKYSPSSTEPTSQDNTLLEDLNIDALNARNKKIFEINSRKHTTVKPKPSGGKTNTVESEITTTTFNISHNDEQVNATTNEILNNFDHLQENVLENVISPPTTTRRPPPSTTTTKMTTLYHIFALSAEDDATTENNNPDEFVTNERREKLVEINRVVEVYSKEDKLTKSKKNNAGKIESSELKLEKNATLERLGEIGRVSYVKSVESGGGKAKSLEDGGELVIEGRSTVADYTPTEPIPAGSESGPVRNVIPVLDGTTEQKKEARKLQLPEVILGVETSTIPLEGLFEAPRKSKELPVSDEPVFAASLGEVYAMKSETSSMVPTVATTSLPPVSTEDTNSFPETTTELPLTTVTEVKTEKPQHYIRPLVPLLRPESNESSPLVISIANLDKVILSKVPRADSSVASSGRISTFIEPPKSINLLDDASLSKIKTATSSSQGRNETVVQTQTSFSSEIQVVRKKLPRRSKSTRRRKSKVDEQAN